MLGITIILNTLLLLGTVNTGVGLLCARLGLLVVDGLISMLLDVNPPPAPICIR